MMEPSVTLSDYFLAAECSSFAAYCWIRHGDGRQWWVQFYISLAIAAIAGGTVHGFFPIEGETVYEVLWTTTLLALGATALAMWGIFTATIAIAPWIPYALIAPHIVYAAAVIGGMRSFSMGIICYLPAALALLVAFTWRWYRGNRKFLVATIGVVLTFIAAAIQVSQIDLHPVWFDHNACYHVVQALGLACLMPAAVHKNTQ